MAINSVWKHCVFLLKNIIYVLGSEIFLYEWCVAKALLRFYDWTFIAVISPEKIAFTI